MEERGKGRGYASAADAACWRGAGGTPKCLQS